MSGKTFTSEDVQILSKNPNTFDVSIYRLSFTKEVNPKILYLVQDI